MGVSMVFFNSYSYGIIQKKKMVILCFTYLIILKEKKYMI